MILWVDGVLILYIVFHFIVYTIADLTQDFELSINITMTWYVPLQNLGKWFKVIWAVTSMLQLTSMQ